MARYLCDEKSTGLKRHRIVTCVYLRLDTWVGGCAWQNRRHKVRIPMGSDVLLHSCSRDFTFCFWYMELYHAKPSSSPREYTVLVAFGV